MDLEDDHEEDLDTTFLYNHQLATRKITQNVKSQTNVAGGHTSSSVEPGGDAVNVTVRWEPHPLNALAMAKKADVWTFKLDRTDNFSDLFESVAEEANIFSDNLVMTYRGSRFFSLVTPQTLNIWSDAEFAACDLSTYEYKRKLAAQAHAQPEPSKPSTKPSQSQSKPQISKPNPDADILDLGSDSDSPEEQGEEPNDPIPIKLPKFKLVLGSGLTSRDITLNVKSATKYGAIVKAFLKKAGLEKYLALMEGGVVRRKSRGGKALLRQRLRATRSRS
ncbi:hypothetical protein BT96DRAFT_1024025 [Gymnopus androsaceus JB14]|uniref:Uncharacterized protein n=1 Tax=Gymnopus androsaceus JB14 TaxID=1447944 RepID=A0A6A4H1E6_9AGAR|nr:hypothetical protein BT96DRAFT_1024025 [Gymnopus androsaceus JB14]